MKVGQLVLLKDDRFPSAKWPLARIKEVHRGNDIHVRVVTLSGPGGTIIKRPITKISPLPVEEPQMESISTTKKKPLLSLKLIAMLCILLSRFRGNVTEKFKITPFLHQPGIYFEGMGTASLVAMNYDVIIHYDLRKYWVELQGIKQTINVLPKRCQEISEDSQGYCNAMGAYVNQLCSDAEKRNMLLLSPNERELIQRNKRGLFNAVGFVAHEFFGILDQNSADKIDSEIDKVNQNQQYLLHLIRN